MRNYDNKDMSESSFKFTDLKNSDFYSTDFEDSNLTNAKLKGAKITIKQLQQLEVVDVDNLRISYNFKTAQERIRDAHLVS